jgi:putative membrane protein
MHRSIVLAAIGALTLPLAAVAATPTTAGPLDEHYLMNSMQGDHFEIDGGKIALANGGCAAVTRLARRLVNDHSASLADDSELARTVGVEIPKSPTPSMQWELAQIGDLTGSQFDKAYSTLEMRDHVEDIENTTEEIAKGATAQVRAAARKELPVLRAHLVLSRAAAAACGA